MHPTGGCQWDFYHITWSGGFLNHQQNGTMEVQLGDARCQWLRSRADGMSPGERLVVGGCKRVLQTGFTFCLLGLFF